MGFFCLLRLARHLPAVCGPDLAAPEQAQ